MFVELRLLFHGSCQTPQSGSSFLSQNAAVQFVPLPAGERLEIEPAEADGRGPRRGRRDDRVALGVGGAPR